MRPPLLHLTPTVGAVAAVLFCSPAQAQTVSYVGSEACQPCHEDIYNAFQKNPHKIADKQLWRGSEAKICESCHGPGGKHAESADKKDIINPVSLSPTETSRVCLKCHLNQPTQIGRLQSSHAKNDVACTACHAIHRNGPNGLVPRKAAAINQQCAACHTSQWAQFQRPYRHRLPEGAMSCVDCHNPHGTFLPHSIQTFAANEPGCFKCHGNVRGPFTYEHAPLRLEGCPACHEVHGSANPRMLVQQEVRLVCLQCHANLPPAPGTNAASLGGVPPAFHDLRSPRFRNCTICHQAIHGSYMDRVFTR